MARFVWGDRGNGASEVEEEMGNGAREVEIDGEVD